MMEKKDGLLLFTAPGLQEIWFEAFLLGVEEEGIPLYIHDSREAGGLGLSARQLADLAALGCCFDLGVGVDGEELAVRHRLQLDEAPLLLCRRCSLQPGGPRLAGHNSARLIKGIPLILAGR